MQLHTAARAGNLAEVQRLIEGSAVDIDAKDEVSTTLHLVDAGTSSVMCDMT